MKILLPDQCRFKKEQFHLSLKKQTKKKPNLVYTKVLRDENAQNFIRNAFLVSFTLSVFVLELSQKYSAINLALFWTLGELIFYHFVKQMFAAYFFFYRCHSLNCFAFWLIKANVHNLLVGFNMVSLCSAFFPSTADVSAFLQQQQHI